MLVHHGKDLGVHIVGPQTYMTGLHDECEPGVALSDLTRHLVLTYLIYNIVDHDTEGNGSQNHDQVPDP